MRRVAITLFFVAVLGCQKESVILNDEASFKTFVVPYATGISVDRQKNEIVIELADYFDWTRITPAFQISKGATVYVGEVNQTSATSSNDFSTPVNYTIISESGKSVKWMAKVQANDNKIGLTGVIEAKNRIQRDYEWYFSQDSSGIHSPINGGAAAVLMAMRFTHRTQFVSYNVSQVRDESSPQIRIDGTMDTNPQPFSTLDVTAHFTKKDIPWKVISLSNNLSEIVDVIDRGYLAILVINMSRVSINQALNDHTHGFYNIPTSVYPHYIVIKGYKKVSGQLFFECYDPRSDGKKYSSNGEIKGRNRYYSGTSLWTGASDGRGWKYAIIVGPKGNAMAPLQNEVRMAQVGQATGY